MAEGLTFTDGDGIIENCDSFHLVNIMRVSETYLWQSLLPFHDFIVEEFIHNKLNFGLGFLSVETVTGPDLL